MVALTAVFAGVAIADNWSSATEALRTARWGLVVVALVAAAGGMTVIAVGWVVVLRGLGAAPPTRRTVAWYYAGEVAKYVPGGVWSVIGRGELARRGGVRRTTAYTSVMVSLLCLYGAAGLIAVCGRPLVGGSTGKAGFWWLVAGLGVALCCLHPAIANRALDVLRRLSKRDLEFEAPPLTRSVAAIAFYLPAWLLIGLTNVLLVSSLGLDGSAGRIVYATAISWLAGFVFILSPGGIGVREAVFIAAAGLDSGDAALVAVLSRLVFVLVDVGGAALSTWALRSHDRGRDAAADTPAAPAADAVGG